MAKKVAATEKEFDLKAFNKIAGQYLTKRPEVQEDGTLKTARYETGIVGIDALLGGGFPQGKVISISTVEGGGKTTLAIQACGNIAEKYNKRIHYFDVEGGATYELIEAMGYSHLLYDPDTNPTGLFYVYDARTIQEISKVLKYVIRDPDTAVIVIDSTTLTTSEDILDDELLGTGKRDVGLHARMWSQAARSYGALIKQTNACMLMIHQARENLSQFFVRTEAARGRALKHLVSAEIWGVVKKWLDYDGNEVTSKAEAKGAKVLFTTDKNRLTMPFVNTVIPIFFGRGASNRFAYREWLENFNITDTTTGEVKKALYHKGSGYWVFSLPFANMQVRGEEAVWDIITQYYDAIVKFVHDNGGFKLNTTTQADLEGGLE